MQVVEAWTDGATLCVFDPAALPSDFDNVVGDDPVGLMEKLQAEGKLWFGGSGGDGQFVCHAYIDEELPSDLQVVAVSRVPAMSFPFGRVFIAGAEYAANDPTLGSPFTPKGGLGPQAESVSSITVKPGTYQFAIYEVSEDASKGKQSFHPSVLLAVLSGLFFVVGAISAVAGALITVLFFVIKIVQIVLSNPLAYERWNVLYVALAFAVGGAALFGLGVLLNRWYNASPSGKAQVEERLKHPDYVLELRSAGRS